MNVSVGKRWESFVDTLVDEGRYGSASEVIREGLRLVEEREAKLHALRDHINAAIARGGENSGEEALAAVREHLARRREKKAS